MADRHTRVTVNETSSQEGDCEPDSTVCGLRDVLDRIGDTWSVLVIIQLRLHGRRRFGQLLRSVEGISQRMLTVTLRRLQRDGLISRTVRVRVDWNRRVPHGRSSSARRLGNGQSREHCGRSPTLGPGCGHTHPLSLTPQRPKLHRRPGAVSSVNFWSKYAAGDGRLTRRSERRRSCTGQPPEGMRDQS